MYWGQLLIVLFQSAICRSAQPLSGVSKRSTDDEQMVQAILQANPNSSFMYIIDTRPKVCYWLPEGNTVTMLYYNEGNVVTQCHYFIWSLNIVLTLSLYIKHHAQLHHLYTVGCLFWGLQISQISWICGLPQNLFHRKLAESYCDMDYRLKRNVDLWKLFPNFLF